MWNNSPGPCIQRKTKSTPDAARTLQLKRAFIPLIHDNFDSRRNEICPRLRLDVAKGKMQRLCVG
jgi:hypothetical protein